ncbi:hypothetical protein C2E23DRAFT_71423 [Lenzites betulinus]|nr:hypothetical protein C2E23DRAFT_71423 [Lenzites betulinus]
MPGTISDKAQAKPDNALRSQGSLQADIDLLSNLLSQNVDESDPDVVELLRRLETAEGIADGVESRLDGIMDHLDNLLHDLESRTAPKQDAGDATVAQKVTDTSKESDALNGEGK